MVTGSINLVHGNRIMSSFYHFAYWKLHNYDKKRLVYRGGGKEGQFIRAYYHVQSRPGIMIVGPTRYLKNSLSKARYPPQSLNSTAWVVGLVQQVKGPNLFTDRYLPQR